MARIAGVDLPRNKRLDIALTYLHGIGKTTASQRENLQKLESKLPVRNADFELDYSEQLNQFYYV